MSIYFVKSDSRDLWNPSNVAGRLFISQAEAVAKELGIETGLGSLVSDEVVVDEEKFKSFAQAFGELMLRTDSKSAAHALTGACFSVVAALSKKLGSALDDPSLAQLVASGSRLVG